MDDWDYAEELDLEISARWDLEADLKEARAIIMMMREWIPADYDDLDKYVAEKADAFLKRTDRY